MAESSKFGPKNEQETRLPEVPGRVVFEVSKSTGSAVDSETISEPSLPDAVALWEAGVKEHETKPAADQGPTTPLSPAQQIELLKNMIQAKPNLQPGERGISPHELMDKLEHAKNWMEE